MKLQFHKAVLVVVALFLVWASIGCALPKNGASKPGFKWPTVLVENQGNARARLYHPDRSYIGSVGMGERRCLEFNPTWTQIRVVRADGEWWLTLLFGEEGWRVELDVNPRMVDQSILRTLKPAERCK